MPLSEHRDDDSSAQKPDNVKDKALNVLNKLKAELGATDWTKHSTKKSSKELHNKDLIKRIDRLYQEIRSLELNKNPSNAQQQQIRKLRVDVALYNHLFKKKHEKFKDLPKSKEVAPGSNRHFDKHTVLKAVRTFLNDTLNHPEKSSSAADTLLSVLDEHPKYEKATGSSETKSIVMQAFRARGMGLLFDVYDKCKSLEAKNGALHSRHQQKAKVMRAALEFLKAPSDDTHKAFTKACEDNPKYSAGLLGSKTASLVEEVIEAAKDHGFDASPLETP